MRLLTSLTAIAGVVTVADAIIVSEGSPCSTKCGNVLDSTTDDDIVCKQKDYAKDPGDIFQSCAECQLHSGYQNSQESDVQWLLYNLRYTMSYCLFNYPENDDFLTTPCMTKEACGPFESAMTFKNLSTDISSYDYCALWPVSDQEHFEQCTVCLQSGKQEYMANFVTVLQAGCEQQPDGDATIAVEGEVFSDDFVVVADPTTHAKVDPSWFDQGPLDVPAIAGIVSGGVVAVLIVAGCCIIWRGKRRRRAFLRNYDAKNGSPGKGWPSPIQTSNMKEVSDTPLSQKPLRTWDDSPQSSNAEQPFQRYFSPYSSQFNSPVSATDAQQQQWPVLGPNHAQHVQHLQQMHHQQLYQQHQQPQQYAPPPPHTMGEPIGVAIGSEHGSESSDSKGKTMQPTEEYEMHNVEHDRYRAEDESYFTHTRQYSGSYRSFSQRMHVA